MLRKKYSKEFTQYQTRQFDVHFKKVMKERLMSFYAYLIHLHEQEQQIKMSIDEISARWNNKHKKKANKEKQVCRATIYNWIKKLAGAKLLHVDEDSADTFVYQIIYEENFLDNKLDENIDEIEIPLATENTQLSACESCDNAKSLVDNLDIDSNTAITVLPTVPTATPLVKLNFKKYSQKCTWDYAFETTEKVFKELKVKSSFVKGLVIDKVEKYYWNISRCGAVHYVAKLVNQVQAQCKKNFEEKCLYNSSNTVSTFNDYPQRTYNLDKLERALLYGEYYEMPA